MNKILIAFILSLCFLSCKEKNQTTISKPTPPNIIVFLVDDMGWQDTSVPFWTQKTKWNEIYETPNMEKLAEEGMKFTQAYATSVCSPTRISFITGMNAARHRVTNWTLKKDKLQPMEVNHPTLSFPAWNVNGISAIPGIPKTIYATPLPQILQDHGYYTIHTGKAHFGAIDTPGENPTNLGFNVNIAGHAAGAPESYLGTENFGNGKEGKKIWAVPGLEKYHGKDIFLTEALTQEAIIAMDTAIDKKQPFFLYMAHYAIHTPIMGDKRFMQKYINKGIDSTEAKYASMIEGMDKSLGDIMQHLSKKKVTDNTIILFMSDNGGLSAVARSGEKHQHNSPLKSGKGSAYEGGIRVPMLVKWPSKTKPQAVNATPIIIEDFFPTILDMAYIKNAKTVQSIDGKSFVNQLTNKNTSNENRPLFWHYPNEWGPEGPGIGASSTVRLGDWKLIYFYEDQHLELYNLKEDISENKDLSKIHPEKVKELAQVLSNYLMQVDAQIPQNKITGEPIKLPIDFFH